MNILVYIYLTFLNTYIYIYIISKKYFLIYEKNYFSLNLNSPI